MTVLSGFQEFGVGRNDGYGRVGIGPAPHTKVQCGCRTDMCFATASIYLFAAAGDNYLHDCI